MSEPARILVSDVVRLTGLPARTVLDLANGGKIPGAAKLGGTRRWTFDVRKVQAWISQEEEEAKCRPGRRPSSPPTRIGAAARSGVGAKSADTSIEAAYNQLIRGKRSGSLKPGATT